MAQVNNRLIIKNSILLFVRMIFVLLISLYTVRAILELLGVEDYGIYNVIGSVVGMLSFLNGTLATSSQKFFSAELATGNYENLKKQFNLNLTVFLLLDFIVLVIAETVGLWFLNYKMTIPAERLFAANIIYQLSIFASVISIYVVPFTALVITHEKMKAFAYISIIEALFKLLMVLVLSIISYDKLIVYGILMLISSLATSIAYIIYCRKRFNEAKFSFYWNSNEFKNLFGFSSWHFIGTISNVVRGQGINILLNVFFGPTVNAARAIAFQVNGIVRQFTDNFTLAVKPQLYKSYSAGEFDDLYKLIMRSTILSVFLASILAIPLIANSEYVLSIWLKKTPEFTVLFANLVLINGIIESTNTSVIVPALATGKIKKFEIVTGSLALLNLPVSYLLLKFGFSAYIPMLITIIFSYITVVWRAFLLKDLINLPYKNYLLLIFKLTFAVTLSVIVSCFLTTFMAKNFGYLIASSFITLIITTILFYFMTVNREEQNFVRQYMYNYYKSIVKK